MTINPTPPVNCRYGAPMGRQGTHWSGPDWPVRFHLRKLPLDSGGYDRGGAYWGIGQPLWYACSEEPLDGEHAELYLRASTRERAKDQVRERFCAARFYR